MCDLSWRMFHVYLKRMIILLFWNIMFCIYLLDPSSLFLCPKAVESVLRELSDTLPFCSRATLGVGHLCLWVSCLSCLFLYIYIFFNSLYRRCSLRPPFFLRLKVCGCRLVYMWEELGSSSFYAAVLDPPPRVCFLNTNALLISKLCFLLIIPLLENLRWIHISTELQILPNSFLNLF